MHNESLSSLKTKEATLEESLKNATAEIEVRQTSIDAIVETSTDLESDLKSKLSKFNYELPPIDESTSFIQ